jgi:nephrocystin-3
MNWFKRLFSKRSDDPDIHGSEYAPTVLAPSDPVETQTAVSPGVVPDPATARVIRVFISSTFRDMMAERDILIKKIFPQLRKLCEERAVTWTEVDLRWGITDEQKAEGKVLPLCLEEIRRCRPYFIGLLGERYGWVPEPNSIPADLLESQLWLKQHLQQSVTELEIRHGVFNEEPMHGHAYFYFRDPKYAESVPDDKRQDFTAENTEASRKLQKLKQKIQVARDEHVCELREGYANPDQLGEWILEDFTKLINSLYPTEDIPDPLDKEAARHEAYARSRRLAFVGREDLLACLDEYVSTSGKPLVLTGESGSGKTALLAKWVDRWREQHPDFLLIEHYVGASPDSSNATALLTRVLKQVRRDIGFESEVPTSQEYLHGWFAYLLNEAARKRQFILIIDGVDDVDRDPVLPDLGWLPAEFPSNCRVILSAERGGALELLEKRGWSMLHIKPLEGTERRHLVTGFLKSCGKTLAQQAVDQIVRSPNTGNPLFLTWLLDELRCVGQYGHLVVRLEECLRADGLDALLELMVRRWLLDYAEDCDLVHQSLTLLLAARDGLSEHELLSVLTTAEGKPVPRATATPFLFAAEPILARSGHQLHIRRGVIERVIRRLATSTTDDAVRAHRRLAGWFLALDDTDDRKVRELPWHLAQTNQWQELHDLLVRPTFLRLLVDRCVGDLIGYWEHLRPRFDPVVSYRIAWDGWRRARPHDREWAFLSDATGKALYFLGNYESSLDMLSEAAEVLEMIDGHQSSSYADAAKTLGVALVKAGHTREAVDWLRNSLDSFRRTIGVYNPATFSAMSSLAGCLVALGDYATAEPLLRQVVGASTEVYGRRADTTLMAMNNLAGLLEQRHALAEAESMQRQVLETLRQTTSEDNPFLLTAMNNLAGTLENQGRLDEAEQWYRGALAGRARVLGEKHPDTVEIMSNLGKLLSKKGDLLAAASLFERGLAILDQAPGSNPVAQAIMSQNYAILLAERGDLSTAEQRCRQSLNQFRSALPPDHPYVLGCVENLGGILLKNGDPSGAAPMLREAVDGYVRAGHIRIQAAVLALAAAYVAQNNQDAAVSLLQAHGMWCRADESDAETPHSPALPAQRSVEADRQCAAFEAVSTAASHNELYSALERFAFITSTHFISRLEAVAKVQSSDVRGSLLERASMLRHLAAGKPLNAECNPVSEAFAALRRATNPGDERMLLRLYPFLESSAMLQQMQRMAAQVHDGNAAEMVSRIARFVNAGNSQSVNGLKE